VVTLNQLNNSIAKTVRAVRRCALTKDHAEHTTNAAAYEAAKPKGDETEAAYNLLISDAEDQRLFNDLKLNRQQMLAVSDKLLALTRDSKLEAAEACLLEEVDPATERCVQSVLRVIDHNVTLANRDAVRARSAVTSSLDALERIMERVASADVLAAEIAAAAKEQAQGINQIGVAMLQIEKVTQANAAGAEQTSSAAEQLTDQARLLRDNVDHLRALVRSTAVGGDGPAVSLPREGLVGRAFSPQRTDSSAPAARQGLDDNSRFRNF